METQPPKPARARNQFLAFVRKEFYHILRDRQTMLILLGLPIVQIIIFGFALSNEVKNARIAVWDQSRDATTGALVAQLEASRYFEIARHAASYQDIEEAFLRGDIKMAVVLPPHFGSDLLHLNKAPVQFIADASDPNVATTLTHYATAIIRDYQDRLTHDRRLPYTIHTETRMLYNPQLVGAYSFVPGVMAMVLMLVCTLMTAVTIVREKEMGTLEVMLVSPIKPIKIILAKAVPYLLLSLVNVASILLLSFFVLQVPIRGSLALLLAGSILYTLTCLALGLLISSATDSQQTAMFISLVGLFLPTVMLSGFMFPIENMPLLLQLISNLVPARWFYAMVTAVMIQGVGLAAIWQETLILAAMTLVLLVLSIRKFKIRLA